MQAYHQQLLVYFSVSANLTNLMYSSLKPLFYIENVYHLGFDMETGGDNE